MSNETDLDWLARNVHVWPEDGVKPIFSKNQWLDRRAELQNKPSWKSAPEWATHLAQHEGGRWWFLEHGELGVVAWKASKIWDPPSRAGEVLGDWRDTLECRPANLSERAVTERLQEATDNVLAAVPELKHDRFKFYPFTSIEDNQEQDMKQDNGWFERGELPPVGAWCEASCEGAETEKCKILAYHNTQVAVQWSQFNDGCLDVLEMHGWDFRPIRTEREKAIEEMVGEFIDHYGDPKGAERYIGIATKLYEIGYRKESK